MNSFRVKNTKFRILKGGKIGLSLSISLMASMLIFNTNANATDYFTNVQTDTSRSITSIGTNPLTVQTASNSGTTNETRSLGSNDDVVFKPTSWANSYYTTPTYQDLSATPPAVYGYVLNKNTQNLALTLTFSNGANANNISKGTTDIYSASPATYVYDVAGLPTQTLTLTSGSTNYSANLIFSGNNSVSGNTNVEEGNIQLNGSVTFTGTVDSATIDVNSTDTTTFNSAVNLSLGSTDDLKFNNSGNIILNSDLTGNVTVTANNQGTITTTGANQTISGNIGLLYQMI